MCTYDACVCMTCHSAHMECGSQRNNSGVKFSPSIFTRIQGSNSGHQACAAGAFVLRAKSLAPRSRFLYHGIAGALHTFPFPSQPTLSDTHLEPVGQKRSRHQTVVRLPKNSLRGSGFSGIQTEVRDHEPSNWLSVEVAHPEAHSGCGCALSGSSPPDSCSYPQSLGLAAETAHMAAQ